MAKVNLQIDKAFFNEVYIPYLNREERFQAFMGGAGSGKSKFLSQKLTLDLLKNKITLLVVMKEYSGMEQKVFKEFLTTFDDMKIRDHMKIRKAPLNITFPNGSEIIFLGADDESKLLSISGITYCWVEEADNISYEFWTQLQLRLRGKGKIKKKFFLSWNPTSATSWLKREFEDNPLPDSFMLRTTYLDNRFLDDEYIAQFDEMKIRNPHKYRIYALGEWGILGKLVYENWEEREFTTSDLMKENPNLVSAFGMDFGYVADPSTMVASLVDLENRKLYIFDEMYEKGLLNNEIAEKIHDMGYSKELIIADSAEQKSIEEIKQYDIPRIKPARKGSGSIMQGIQFIQQFDIIVHPKCKHTIDELKHYSFKKDKQSGMYLNVPIDSSNHILDALRYSLESHNKKKGKALKLLPSSMFGL